MVPYGDWRENRRFTWFKMPWQRSWCMLCLCLSWKMHGIISVLSFGSKNLIAYPIRSSINSSYFCKAPFITIINVTITVSTIIIIIIMIRCNYDDSKKVVTISQKHFPVVHIMLCMQIYLHSYVHCFVCDHVLILVKPAAIGCSIKCLSLSLVLPVADVISDI